MKINITTANTTSCLSQIFSPLFLTNRASTLLGSSVYWAKRPASLKNHMASWLNSGQLDKAEMLWGTQGQTP